MSDQVIDLASTNVNGSTFDEFHGRHRDTRDPKRPRLSWMPDFNRAKEGIVNYPHAALKWRILEYAKQMSWGNKQRDYAAHVNGDPLTQREFADALNVPFQKVSLAIQELVAEGFLGKEGRIIMVIDDPIAARAVFAAKAAEEKQSPARVMLDELKAKAASSWQTRNPQQFQQYQTLGVEIAERFKEIEERRRERSKLEEADWEAFQQTEVVMSDTGVILDSADHERGGETLDNGGEESSDSGVSADAPILTVFRSKVKELASSLLPASKHEQQIRQAIEATGLANLPGRFEKAIENAALRYARVEPARQPEVLTHYRDDLRQIAGRQRNKPQSWGIIVTAMEDAIDAVLRPRRVASPAPPAASTVQPEPVLSAGDEMLEIEEFLKDSPNSQHADEFRRRYGELKAQQPAVAKAGA